MSAKKVAWLVCVSVYEALNNAIEYSELINGNGPIRLLESYNNSRYLSNNVTTEHVLCLQAVGFVLFIR